MRLRILRAEVGHATSRSVKHAGTLHCKSALSHITQLLQPDSGFSSLLYYAERAGAQLNQSCSTANDLGSA